MFDAGSCKWWAFYGFQWQLLVYKVPWRVISFSHSIKMSRKFLIFAREEGGTWLLITPASRKRGRPICVGRLAEVRCTLSIRCIPTFTSTTLSLSTAVCKVSLRKKGCLRSLRHGWGATTRAMIHYIVCNVSSGDFSSGAISFHSYKSWSGQGWWPGHQCDENPRSCFLYKLLWGIFEDSLRGCEMVGRKEMCGNFSLFRRVGTKLFPHVTRPESENNISACLVEAKTQQNMMDNIVFWCLSSLRKNQRLCYLFWNRCCTLYYPLNSLEFCSVEEELDLQHG